MIGADEAVGGNQFAGECPESALHPVADDRAANLLGDCEADSLQRIAILAVANEEHESGHRRAPSGVRSEEIRPLSNGFETLPRRGACLGIASG
jgi:hypothetical protein